MQKIVQFELQLRNQNIFSAEFVLQFYQLIFKVDSGFSFVVQIVLKLFLSFSKLFPLIFEHELNFTETTVIFEVICILNQSVTSGLIAVVVVIFGDVGVAERVGRLVIVGVAVAGSVVKGHALLTSG